LTETTRKRSSATRKTDCPFEVKGTLKDGEWVLSIKNGGHNHEPSDNLLGHPRARRLGADNRQVVEDLSASGIAPRHILASLRHSSPNVLAIAKTIYNERARIQRASLGGRTPIQAFLDGLRENNVHHDYDVDAVGRINRLFFSPQPSSGLLQSYPHVLVMDCTYRTNRYKIPLLHVVGMAGTNLTFTVCCVLFFEK